MWRLQQDVPMGKSTQFSIPVRIVFENEVTRHKKAKSSQQQTKAESAATNPPKKKKQEITETLFNDKKISYGKNKDVEK
ncbi:uncharacterized protein LOC123681025 isoform X2 [Harmonia axyridis]|uniref:uncharacterized protein LOC123681025 isoform X2 n=1 Tax=Harmonia axyridis TaxID=115357 RepID=UPI001E274DC5|nr:uncharacterized protein LOC123681025 isoform X2 [Harmonia axyridis]